MLRVAFHHRVHIQNGFHATSPVCECAFWTCVHTKSDTCIKCIRAHKYTSSEFVCAMRCVLYIRQEDDVENIYILSPLYSTRVYKIMFRFWYVCNVYLRWNYTNRTHQQHRHTTHAQMHCKLWWWWRWWCSVHASYAYRALCFTSQHSIDDINLPRKRTCINAGVVRMCSFYIALSPLCSMYKKKWGWVGYFCGWRMFIARIHAQRNCETS